MRARSSRGFRALEGALGELGARANLAVVESVDTTNALARRGLERLGRTGLSRPWVLAARSQTSGKGRQGRGWESPPDGGVYLSVLAPVSSARTLERLPIEIPVSLCRALRGLGVECLLKWPNDLIVDGKKLAGVLVEAVWEAAEPRAAIIGVGVNYQSPQLPSLLGRTTGLVELLESPPSLSQAASKSAAAILEVVETEVFSRSLVDEYRDLSAHRLGDPLICRTAAGTVEGRFSGFDQRGFLRLSRDGDEQVISSGSLVE